MTIPILVEANVRVLRAEIDALRKADGPHSHTFAQGAITTLEWLMDGKPRPSEHLLANIHD